MNWVVTPLLTLMASAMPMQGAAAPAVLANLAPGLGQSSGVLPPGSRLLLRLAGDLLETASSANEWGTLDEATRRGRRGGVRVGWCLQLLELPAPDPADGGPLPSAERLAKNRGGGTRLGSTATSRYYLSPFHDEARAAMVKLVEELASLPTAPDFLVISWRYPRDVLLGFGDAERLAYIREREQDPYDVSGPVEGNAWLAWRTAKMSAYLTEVLAPWRRRRPEVPVIALVTGEYPVAHPSKRLCAADDWPYWLSAGVVDGAILDSPWHASEAVGLWRRIVQAVGTPTGGPGGASQAPVETRLDALVSLHDAGGKPCGAEQMRALAVAGVKPEHLVIRVQAEEDWASLPALWQAYDAVGAADPVAKD